MRGKTRPVIELNLQRVASDDWRKSIATCEAQQQGQVGVLTLSPLGEDAAEGAQLTQAGPHLQVQLMGETSPSRLQPAAAATAAAATAAAATAARLPAFAHLLLQGDVLLHQFLVLARQLEGGTSPELSVSQCKRSPTPINVCLFVCFLNTV